jgi:hypothetical protein
MGDPLALNLIHLFDFYLAIVFLTGLLRRMGQYHAVGTLVLAGRSRWPHLIELVNQYRTIFLTWEVVLPGAVALSLSLVQWLTSRLVWPYSDLTLGALLEHWPYLLVCLPLGAAMVYIDLYGLVKVGQLDRALLEKHFDLAEYWLRSRTAHVVRVFTFGFVNPRKMVGIEVRKALHQVSDMLHNTLWWVSMQITLRVGFGLSLWLAWLLTRQPANVG